MLRKVDELLREAKSADDQELREILSEMASIVRESTFSSQGEHDLAEAVRAFAEWQYGGYEGREAITKRVVGQQLWYEVSDRVVAITGFTPPAPTFGAAEHDA